MGGKLDDEMLRWSLRLSEQAEPEASRKRMVLADDLMEHNVLWQGGREALERAVSTLTTLIDDASRTDAEVKGVLNRACGRVWGIEYERVFKPREFVIAIRDAVNDYLRRHPELR